MGGLPCGWACCFLIFFAYFLNQAILSKNPNVDSSLAKQEEDRYACLRIFSREERVSLQENPK